MSELSIPEREIVARARQLEQERIEIYARAVEARIADLLPSSWGDLDAAIEDPVEVRITLGLTDNDPDAWSDRECREFVRFMAQTCAEARFRRLVEEDDGHD